MKFKWLDLKAFGQFSKHPIRLFRNIRTNRFDLRSERSGKKHSACAAVFRLDISEFPAIRAMPSLHPHNSLRVGGELVDANDRSLDSVSAERKIGQRCSTLPTIKCRTTCLFRCSETPIADPT